MDLYFGSSGIEGVLYYVDKEFCVLHMGCSIHVHSCWCTVEVMDLGCVAEYKLCCSCYLVWKFFVGQITM